MNTTFSYLPITCKSALNRVDSFMPYHYDLNIYRGCEHQCAYCFAQYTHRYLEDGDFFHNIYVKKNVVEQLEKKLKSKNWARDVINIGGVTDSYQNVEAIEKRMPEILKLLIKYKTPAIISTKSSLILRDIDLLKELSDVAGLQIAFTITTLNQDIASKLEPGASSVKERIEAIKTLKEAGLTVGWHLMPIIPYVTATKKNLEAIFQLARKLEIDYMITSLLNLRGETRKNFFHFMKENFKEQWPLLYNVYQNKEQKTLYKKELAKLLLSYEKKYQVSRNYRKFVPVTAKEDLEQLTLFEQKGN